MWQLSSCPPAFYQTSIPLDGDKLPSGEGVGVVQHAEAGRGRGKECHQPGEGWLLSSVLQVCLHQRSLNFLSVLPKGSADWIRESPEEISSSKREDVSRSLLFSSVVSTEGAGMSILVPVVMEAKDGTWSFALLISRTTGLKYYQGRCDPCPSASSLQPRLRQSTQREPCQGCRMRFQWPLSF